MPERAGEHLADVDVVPPVLLCATDEVPSVVAVAAAGNNWDADTVPGQEEGAASTSDAVDTSGTLTRAAVVGIYADARGPITAEGDTSDVPTEGEEASAGPHHGHEQCRAGKKGLG